MHCMNYPQPQLSMVRYAASTTAHLVIGKSLVAIAEVDVLSIPNNINISINSRNYTVLLEMVV